MRSKRRALPERPSRRTWRERRSTRASAVERHVVDMQRVVSRRRSCERQRRRDRHAHARTTVTSVENDTRFSHHELRSKRRALPERPSRRTWRERRSTRASAVERHVVDMQRVVSRRRSCERQRRRDRHAHARTTVTSVENDTRFSHHELRSKRRALPERPSRRTWRERRSTRASAVERHVVDMQRVVSRRRSCERQRRRDRHAHARTTVTSVENDTRFSITSCGRNDERSPSDRRGARGANDDRPERAPWSDTSSTCNEW